jgi:hypothetical protein
MALKASRMDAPAKVFGDPATAARSLSTLLRNLIDYAGLFPPAALAMPAAVANYEKYLRSDFNWMLGRFIVPATRLGEFTDATGALPSSGNGDVPCWDLSALLGPDVSGDFARVSEFNAHRTGSTSPKLESVEVKVTSPAEIEKFSRIICAEMETYFEIPWAGGAGSASMRECINAVRDCGRRAKVRTGGETADKFPPAKALIEFIEACAAGGVAFKATAGLHHPLRSRHRLTYKPDSPSGMTHGFLNVFLAAGFVRAGMDASVAIELLNEQLPDSFEFDSDGVSWQGHRLSVDQIAEARRDFSIAFGSCSFTEPIEDLQSLHLL